MNGFVRSLPRITRVWQEEIRFELPFEKIGACFAHDPGTLVLLSGSDLDSSQTHIMGMDPWLELRGRGEEFFLSTGGKSHRIEGDIFSFLKELTSHFRLPEKFGSFQDLPLCAGLMGYFAYDLKDRIEDLPRTCRDTHLPDICLYAPSLILVQDRSSERIVLSVPVPEDVDFDSYRDRIRSRFFQRISGFSPQGEETPFFVDGRGFRSSFTKPEYIRAVKKIIQYLREGDIYQANLSQRFETRFSGDAYALFLQLFKKNPAPFFSFVHARDHKIISTSPERFVRVKGKKVETRPIKGTIARGKTPQEDEEKGRALASSIKDDAELTMIVDLMRNDLSRVTRHDTVVVTEHKRLEPYDNVFHLVSVVTGELEPDKTCVDLLKAVFPGGSITGCPKIRSMEIIDELESVKRHVYTGSIGYLSFHDTMDLSIAIRTATVKDQSLYFSVGGGIVYDSDPEKEFQETLDKGKTLLDILARASQDREFFSPRAWVAGKLVDQDRAMIPAQDPGFQYGAGLFETVRVEKGDPLFLEEHIKRMEQSWRFLFHSSPPDITWPRVVDLLIRENCLETSTAAVKLMISLADGGRTGENQAVPAAFARPYAPRPVLLEKQGLDLVTFPHPRQTPLAGHKTLNYLFYEQARIHALEKGGDEALILNPDLTVSETNTCNILIRDGRTLILPLSVHVLPGITQKVVADRLETLGVELVSRPVPAKDFSSYSDILLTNSLVGAVRVLHVDGREIRHDPDFCEQINGILEKARGNRNGQG
ncbi:aminodeoxychorismate synthase component I [Desulfospira joergensenii]|uniref:aminodeoxychorismate synthase component I n=1 Tax=Desulfospira joergensenii TaxID=53329 RepID=UPI0003B37CC4|nr:aminodeoxychorismate synthase component I [Desulfospira joergensenii]